MAKDPVLKKKEEEEEEEVEVEGKIIFFKSSSVSPSSRSPLKSLGLRHPGTLRTMRVAEMGCFVQEVVLPRHEAAPTDGRAVWPQRMSPREDVMSESIFPHPDDPCKSSTLLGTSFWSQDICERSPPNSCPAGRSCSIKGRDPKRSKSSQSTNAVQNTEKS